MNRPRLRSASELINGPRLEASPIKQITVFFGMAIFWLSFVVIVKAYWPAMLPFDIFALWKIKHGNLGDWLLVGLPVFVWGVTLTTIVSAATTNHWHENQAAEHHFARDSITSLVAGVMEEIVFRWIYFFAGIIVAQIVNYLFFGWADFGIWHALQLHVLGPIANFTTFGAMKSVLVNPATWMIGAGMLWANGHFRDGHKYLGFFGFVNSWFIGMFLFWVTLTYGLIAAIVIHFTYDFAIAVVRYLDRVYERRTGRGIVRFPVPTRLQPRLRPGRGGW